MLILYEICSAENLKSIIHWTDDGKAFKIESRELFEEHVLPKFYKHSNFNSFQRQLNMYDFHKKTRSINEIVFVHENFREGNTEELIKITRKSNPASEHHEKNQLNSIAAYSARQATQKLKPSAIQVLEELKDKEASSSRELMDSASENKSLKRSHIGKSFHPNLANNLNLVRSQTSYTPVRLPMQNLSDEDMPPTPPLANKSDASSQKKREQKAARKSMDKSVNQFEYVQQEMVNESYKMHSAVNNLSHKVNEVSNLFK